MPQMNPIWWIPLFITFILIFMMTNPLNYFSNFNEIQLHQSQPVVLSTKWTW